MAGLPNKLKAKVVLDVKYQKISTIRHHIAIYIIKFGRWLLGLPFTMKMKVVEVK